MQAETGIGEGLGVPVERDQRHKGRKADLHPASKNEASAPLKAVAYPQACALLPRLRFRGQTSIVDQYPIFSSAALPRSEIDTTYRALLDEIEATLHDPGGAALLAAHLQDLPDLIQGLHETPQESGRIEILVDRSGRVVSQNAACAQRLGLQPGEHLDGITLSPQAAQRVLTGQDGAGIPLLVADPAGGTIFLFGQAVENDGPILLTEVQRGIDASIRTRLAASVGLIASEGQLLKGLMQGKSVQVIARDLDRTEGTVRQQLKSIMAKMGVNSQQQLISTAYALSLMDQQARPATSPVTVDLQGATLHKGRHGVVGLHAFGPADGVPVLLLHGALFGIGTLPGLRGAAQTLGLRILAPERPGYGHTALGEDGNPIGLAVRQAVDILDSHGLQRVVVLAHDIGTRFAAQLALRVPNRVAAVIAAPATPPMQTWAQTADMPTRHRVNAWAAQHLPGLMDKIVALGLAQIARNGVEVIPRLVFDGCDFDQAILRQPAAGAVLQEAFHLAWAQRGAGFRADMRLTNEDWQDEARRISAPFLCLHGAQSRTVSRSAVEALARTLPNGRFRLVEGAGHSLPVSHPALILRAALAAGQAAALGGDEFGFRSEG
jgi:pimeloyl-ACP methyl ester carboxylesterase/DNA-binding CsgD family transcriptional regulator